MLFNNKLSKQMVFEKSKNMKFNHNISSLSTEKMLANFLNLKSRDKSETESKKRKAEESDKIYEKSKRKRAFQSTWLESYKWLRYDSDIDKMFCVHCEKFPSLAGKNVFVSGTDRFRLDPIKYHLDSSNHKSCSAQYMRATGKTTPIVPVAATPCGALIQRLSDDRMARMRVLFNTAYYLATNMRPFSDFKGLCDLQEINGVQIGNMYRNDMACRDFISSIHSVVSEEIKLRSSKCNFVSILADGSTDVSINEQEVVYIRYVSDGEIITDLVDIVDLKSGDATGVMGGLESAMTTIGLSFDDLCEIQNTKPTLVCANFDGASVMQGLKTGTMSKILDKVPWTIPMHCVAHKLELAALDAVKRQTYLKKFEDVIKGIYCFYHFSPKRRREVKEIAMILESPLFHISGIKQVRWLSSKSKALQGLRKNITTIRTHLEHVAERKSSDEAARAKGYLRDIKTKKFVYMLHIMCDITEILQSLSQKFQEQSLLICDVYPAAESTLLQLESLKFDKAKNMKEFDLGLEGDTFNGMEVTGDLPKDLLTDLVDDLVTYIDKRFVNFNQPPLRSFSAFSYEHFPDNRSDLCRHGREQVQEILDHFQPLFPAALHDTIQKDYINLKVELRQYKNLNLPKAEVFKQVLKSDGVAVNSAKQLLEIMMVLSPSTAECERGFSLMNNIKTTRRNCLKQDTLQSLMVIKSQPKLTPGAIDSAIGQWVTSGPGGKHV